MIGVERKQLRDWRRAFAIFDEQGDARRLTVRDVSAARALKRLLLEENYSPEEAHRLIAEAGASAVIAVYGAAAAAPNANPAHVLQAAVHSAAAAGFFGAVVAEIDAEGAAHEDPSEVASYAKARLARLPSAKP